MRLALLLVMVSLRTAAADYVNGATDEVRAAETVLLGRAQTADETRAWPTPPKLQRIVVTEVLAGVWFERHVMVTDAVAPGGRVVVVVRPRQIRGHAELAITPPPARVAPLVWPLAAKDTLPVGLVAEGADGRIVMMQGRTAQPLTLTDLRAIVTKVRPDDAGIAAKVIEAALGKPGTGTPAVLAAIYDVARDVPRLAMLLESEAPAIREPAAKRLVAIAGSDAGMRPVQVSPRELAAWRERWMTWWLGHRDPLLAPRRYPAVPAPVVPPKIQQATALLAALDGGAFATEMVRWLDAGLVRDRDLRGSVTDETASRWPGADLAGLAYHDPIGFAPLAELLDRKLPAPQRLAALATIVIHAHAERFAAERVTAAKLLATRAPCSPEIRAAAYWELVDSYTIGPAHAAYARLAACDDPSAVAFIETVHRLRPDSPVLGAVAARLTAKDPAFTKRLLDFVRASDGAASGEATMLLAAGDRRVVAVAIGWLRSPKADTRSTGAYIIDRAHAPEALPALVAALKLERDDSARRMELVALAPIADRRAFDVLVAIAKSPGGKTGRSAIAVALGTIKDKRALAVLATLADTAGDDQQGAMASVNAFCWISGLCSSYPPALTSSVDPAYIQAGLAVIATWRKP